MVEVHQRLGVDRAMTRRATNTDVSILSYLDVLCCGFGGAIFLFFVFAAAAGSSGVPSPEFASTSPASGGQHTLVIRWTIDSADATMRVIIHWPALAPADEPIRAGYCPANGSHRHCVRASSTGQVALGDLELDGAAMWLWSHHGDSTSEVMVSLTVPSRDDLEDVVVQLRCDVCDPSGAVVSQWAGWTGEPGTIDRSSTLDTTGVLASWPPVAD